MDSDDFRFWLVILGAIGVAFAAVIGSTFTVCHHIERMAELGYEEEPVPGSNRLMWRRRTPPKAEPRWDLTPAQPVVPEDIIKYITNDVPRGIIDYITTNVPPNLYDLVSVTPEQLNAWTSVHQTVVCPRCGQELNWSEPLRCYVGVVTNHTWEAK